MEREKRLPDVLLMSDKASTLMSNSTKDVCIFVESDGQSVSFKDKPSEGVSMDITAEYCNIIQLWYPATEKPDSVGEILCWSLDGKHFVHDYHRVTDECWRKFVSENKVKRYYYISDLEPDWLV